MIRALGAFAIGALMLASIGHLQASPPQQPAVESAKFDHRAARAVLDKYCVTCHNARLNTANLILDRIDLANVSSHADPLEKVVRKLQLRAMPPVGMPRPDPATYETLTSWLESSLDRESATHPRPGRTETLHRLNRAEYQNVIRDLLGLDGIDVSLMLPPDDASYGFDNIAGVLGISPTHLERYLDAAGTISRVAVGDVTLAPAGETYRLSDDLSQDHRFEGLPFGTRGGTSIRRYFPVDAEYVIRFQAFPGVGTAANEPNEIELMVDGVRVFFAKVEQRRGENPSSDWEVRVPIKAGPHDVAVTFVNSTSSQLEDLLQPYIRPPRRGLSRVGGYSGPYVSQVSFTGPFSPTGPGDTPSRRRIFICRPSGTEGDSACARRILAGIGRSAYRRPVTPADVNELMKFYSDGRAEGGFERGIQVALQRLLASPDFLFRIEGQPEGSQPGTVYRVTDLELASRLSFFLWSSMPDEELLSLAIDGKLRTPGTLARQVRRMLRDSRSSALVSNFAGQWLRLRNLEGLKPDMRLFPDFDTTLAQGFRRETELFFDSIIKEDRSVLDLLAADYTFVNERLARHYGIPNVYGPEFRRVTITDANRRGLLGHGSILSVTSQPNRTAPVIRGKWVLENLLAAPPPPPPPVVPSLDETKVEGTLRQRMEQHRQNPACATCHKVMDPLGFALENFDALGEWRSHEAGLPVDADGAMPDGTTFKGVVGLREALLANSNVFVAALTEKLLTYGLGRGVEYFDGPSIREITRQTAKEQYRFSALIVSIVNSVPFQMRETMSNAPSATTVAAVH